MISRTAPFAADIPKTVHDATRTSLLVREKEQARPIADMSIQEDQYQLCDFMGGRGGLVSIANRLTITTLET